MASERESSQRNRRALRQLANTKARRAMWHRFWSKVNPGGLCWEWTAARRPDGYGTFGVAGVSLGAHRVAYSLAFGLPKAGLTLDHLCRNTSCVNP